MSKVSRLLVIDASVLRSAGQAIGHSAHCSSILGNILDICHRAILSPEIKSEWDKHHSRLAVKWRGSMIARKKLLNIDLVTEANVSIRSKISELTGISDKDRVALEKDAHIIDAALRASKIIVTGDVRLRALVHKWLGLKEIEWLVVHQDDSMIQRKVACDRLIALSQANPSPRASK